MMGVALCYAEGGGSRPPDMNEAARTLQRAYDLAAQHKLLGMQQEVAMLQVRPVPALALADG